MTATSSAELISHAADASQVMFEVNSLKVHFPIREGVIFDKTVGHVKAVDGVSFNIRRRR